MAQHHDTHPTAAPADAGLLDLIGRYRAVRDAKFGALRVYTDQTKSAAVRNAARLVFIDREDGYFTLEGEIVETPAQTSEGAVAKALLAIEALDRKRPIPIAGLAYSALADLVPEDAIPGGPLYLRDGSEVAMRDKHSRKLLEPIADPDAELLAVCAEFDAVEHRRNAMFDDDTLTDGANAAIREEQAPLVDRLCDLQAVTIQGMRARARSLVLYDDEVLERRTVYTNGRIVAAVLRDLIGEAGA